MDPGRHRQLLRAETEAPEAFTGALCAPPVGPRRLVVGGSSTDTDRAIIVWHLQEFSVPHPNDPNGWVGRGVEDCCSPEYSLFGRSRFEISEHMWRFLKHRKGPQPRRRQEE